MSGLHSEWSVMDLDSAYGAYKKTAVRVVVSCGLVNVVLMMAPAGGKTGPSNVILAAALLVLSCGLPVLVVLRQLGVRASLAVFVGAMLVNGAVLGATAFPGDAFALLAAVTAGAAATVLTLRRAEQPAAGTRSPS